MLVPYANPPRCHLHGRFNKRHAQTRVIIEQCFGLLKRRFPVLHGECRFTPEKTCAIVIACMILHNIAVLHKLPTFNGPDDQDNNIIYHIL